MQERYEEPVSLALGDRVKNLLCSNQGFLSKSLLKPNERKIIKYNLFLSTTELAHHEAISLQSLDRLDVGE